VFISAELEEVLRVASRVAVLRAGRIVETLPSEDLTVDSLMALVAQPDEFSETASFPTPPTGGGTE
jgi:monosaccharide-transporting ATPase